MTNPAPTSFYQNAIVSGLQAVYLGPFGSAPTTDNFGNPLVAGQLYYNTTSNQLFMYTGSVWQLAIAGTFAAPSALVGTTAITGSSGTMLDAASAPAINQGMSPAWTAAHTWTGTGPQVTLGANGGNSGSLTLKGSTSGNSTLSVNSTGIPAFSGSLGLCGSTPPDNFHPFYAVTVNAGGGLAGVIWNNSSTAGTSATLQLTTGTANSFTNLQQVDGSSPRFQIVPGSGTTGGVLIDASGATGAPIKLNPASGQSVIIGTNGSVGGSLTLNGVTSGSATFTALSAGGFTLNIPTGQTGNFQVNGTTAAFFNSGGFASVSGLFSGTAGIASGSLTLTGSTSGSANINVNGTGQLAVNTNTGSGTIFNDGANGTMLILSSNGAVANQATIQPGQTGHAPTISASGSDTNIGLTLAPKGSGTVVIGGYLATNSGGFQTIAGTGTVTSGLVILSAAGGGTLTLPASPATGQHLWIKASVTTTVAYISAASNVVPLQSGTAGTAMLPIGGKFLHLVFDGTNWQVMEQG